MDGEQKIYYACLLPFNPIMMTNMVAPLSPGHSDGAEWHRPLDISIVGDLLVNQVLTRYTTPVVCLTLDRLRCRRLRSLPGAA